MSYPTVTWTQAAFATLERFKRVQQPFTSLDFKKELRDALPGEKVYQKQVGEFLRQAFEDGHINGFELEDNGTYRVYKPVADTKSSFIGNLFRGMFGFLGKQPNQD